VQAQRIGTERGVLARDEEHHRLAAVRVGHTDGGHVIHAGMQPHGVFDLRGKGFHAGDHDQVLLAIDELDIALRVHAADVAGEQPSAGREVARGFLRSLPIAGHHLRTAHPDFTDAADRHRVPAVVEDRHVGRRDRQAELAAATAGVHRVGADDRRGLGHAIAFDDGPPEQHLPAIGHRGLQRHAARDSDLHVRAVVGGHIGEAG
jgi:hypothetical protein